MLSKHSSIYIYSIYRSIVCHAPSSRIMSTFGEGRYQSCLTILFIVGVIPFNIKSLTCTWPTFLYPSILFFFVSLLVGLISYQTFFSLSVAHMLRDTYNISTYIQSTTVIFVYYLCMIIGVLKRRQHCDLLNSLAEFDRNSIPSLRNRHSSMSSANYELIIMTVTIVGMVTFFYVSLRYSLNVGLMLVFQVCYKFEILTIMLMSLHMRNVAAMLTERFHRIAIDIGHWLPDVTDAKHQRLTKSQQSNHYHKYEYALDLFDTLTHVTEQFNKAFGIQLILGVAFYFTLITVNVYYFVLSYLERGVNVLRLVYFVLNTLPYIAIAFHLVAPLDQLAEKVRYSICFVSLMRKKSLLYR